MIKRSPLNKRLSYKDRRIARQWARDAYKGEAGIPQVLKLPVVIVTNITYLAIHYEYVHIYYRVWHGKRGYRGFAVDEDGCVVG